jgi:hypothetical protein
MSSLRAALCTALSAILLNPLLISKVLAHQNVSASSAPSASPPAGQWDTGEPMDGQWHFGFTPYLWFAGMHGTTGVRGYYTSVKASPGELLSHFNMGLMGTTSLRKNHFVMPVDLMWIRLTDNHSVPENPVGFTNIDFRVGQFLLTPAAGYRIVDKWNLKVDALAGLRYWHLGEKLTFHPTVLNGVSASQEWVDGLGGARFQMFVTPKLSMTIAGDAGGGAALPDYEVVGLVGWKIKKCTVLQAGWRYMDVHYRNNSNLYLYDVATVGGIMGATFTFK